MRYLRHSSALHIKNAIPFNSGGKNNIQSSFHFSKNLYQRWPINMKHAIGGETISKLTCLPCCLILVYRSPVFGICQMLMRYFRVGRTVFEVFLSLFSSLEYIYRVTILDQITIYSLPPSTILFLNLDNYHGSKNIRPAIFSRNV